MATIKAIKMTGRKNKIKNRGDDSNEAITPLNQIDVVEQGMMQWRHEFPDLDCSGKAVVGRILRLQGVILKQFDAALAPFGFKYPSFAVLATLRASGKRYELSPSQLREKLLLSSGGISNLLARLEEKGYIIRINSKNDRREVIVRLTETGVSLIEQAMQAHAAAELELIKTFSLNETEQISRLLSQLLLSHEGLSSDNQPS
jgi:DNA-binding MarR family transcriptional regulator